MRLQGLIFVFVGVLSLIFPYFAGVATELLLGVGFVVAGGALLAPGLRRAGSAHRPGHLATGAIVAIGGILLLFAPMVGIAAFTLLIAIAFLLQGALQGFFALSNAGVSNRGWVLFSSALALLAGFVLLVGWPSSAAWLVGLLVGVNFLFVGVALLTTEVEATYA